MPPQTPDAHVVQGLGYEETMQIQEQRSLALVAVLVDGVSRLLIGLQCAC